MNYNKSNFSKNSSAPKLKKKEKLRRLIRDIITCKFSKNIVKEKKLLKSLSKNFNVDSLKEGIILYKKIKVREGK